jgi:serine protease AprX
MKKLIGCFVLVFAISTLVKAQTTRYIIRFRDKGTSPYSFTNPLAYLSQRAVDRRTRYSIPLDSTDLPITPRYIDSLRLAGNVTIINKSKWLNSVSIQTSDATALAKINSFPFVLSVTGIAPRIANTNTNKLERDEQPLLLQRENDITADFFNYGSSFNQVHIHNGEFLHNIGLRGQSMVICMLDAGFNNYHNLKAFDSVRINGQVLGIYDFVAKDSSVEEDDVHGMECFSTIAANIPGQFVGTAPKANFYLFRTENSVGEYPIEEHNWVCGAERVDSVGGDVISSSLGYNTFDSPVAGFSHTYADMNGNTTMPAIGADLAAKKGILVVNSAGNEGSSPWKFIVTPADGDSVMAVGAVNTAGWAALFTSLGPSFDGQVKPDVASVGVGTIVQLPGNTVGGNNGTSFSAPNMAGLTTCLWQGFPEYNNMRIIDALRKSGSRANNPNDSIGYGIPDVKKALINLLKTFATSSASIANCRTTISWTSKDMSAMKYEIERMLPGQSSFITITQQNGSGSIFSTRSAYQYEDVLNNVQAGTITYRIRQIIDTAAATLTADYIDTATVNLASACTATGITPVTVDNEITLSPNPAKEKFTLKITTSAPVSKLIIRIFDGKGREVAIFNRSKSAGTTSFDFPISNFASGKYYVSIYDGSSLMTTKELIKL